MRSRGRDRFDVWFLLQQDVEIDAALFERKKTVLGVEPVVSITISEATWDRDLSVLLEHPPAYDAVLEDVTDAVGEAGIPVDGATY